MDILYHVIGWFQKGDVVFLYILCIYGRKRYIFIFTMEWVGVWPKLKYCTFLEPFLYRVDLVVRGPPGGKKHITLYISPGSWDCQIENDSWIWSRQEGEHVTHSALYLMQPNFQSPFVVLLDYYCFQAILQQCNLSLRCHWFVALNQYWFYSPPLNQDSKVIVGGPPDAILISVAPLPSIIRAPKIGKQLRERSQ